MPTVSLPKIELTSGVPKDADVVILGLTEDGLTAAFPGVEAKKLTEKLGAKVEEDCVVLLPSLDGPHCVVVGLPFTGEEFEDHEVVRRAVGKAVNKISHLPSTKGLKIAIDFNLDDPMLIKGLAEGALLASYEYAKISTAKPSVKIQRFSVVSSNRNQGKEALVIAETIASAVCAAREWINIPANLLYPQSFAEAAKAHLAGSKVSVEILDEKALAKGGYGGILAVGGGSSRKPRLVRMSYAPRGAKVHLALVGKGITFDAGGLDLKTADGMYTMKCDMSGAAAVIAAIRGIADLGLKVKVTAYASMAENLPSSTAYRPSDVLTMYGGKTVENANTDAEGRLVMADALARASEDNPTLIVDIATLTGACMIALGAQTAGLMASDVETAELLLDATEAAGEPFWHLPITDEVRKGLKSKVADIRSSGTKRYGGSLGAAAFLQSFVPEDMPWAHLDIAGPAFNEGAPYDYVSSGGTGFGVRTLIALAHRLAG